MKNKLYKKHDNIYEFKFLRFKILEYIYVIQNIDITTFINISKINIQ